MPASTISELTGRARATSPVANCGASRVSVAAAVNGERSERADHEAVHGLSRRRPQQAHHHRGHQHQEHAPDRDAEPLSRYPARRDPGAQRHAVRACDDRTGQQYPPDAEPDTQRRGEKQCARGHIAEDVGLPHVQQEQQRKAERRHRDQCRGHSQRRERDQREQHDDKRQLERSSGPVRQLGKQRTGQRRPQEVLTGIGAVCTKS